MTDWTKIKLNTDQNLPLYLQISEKLRTMIHSGELKKGDRIPPSSELQKVFRVSAITVENGVTALVQEGLLQRRQRLGTFIADAPAPQPKQPPANRCINIIFNTNRPGGHGNFELICGMEQICKADGYTIRFSINHPDKPENTDYLTENCAGLVLMGMPKMKLIQELSQKLPLVLLGDPEDSAQLVQKNLDYVVNDDMGRAYHCIKHLVELGHRRIMAIITPLGTPYERMQKLGLEKAAKDFNLSPEEFHIYSVVDYLQECGYKAAYPALCSAPRPTACMTSDASLAVGVMKAAGDLGLTVPKDLSLITFGPQFDCERKEPQLTCFESSHRAVPCIWEKLRGQMNNPKYKKSKTVIPVSKFCFGTSTRYYKGEE